jgi:hypothetical protein
MCDVSMCDVRHTTWPSKHADTQSAIEYLEIIERALNSRFQDC